TTFMVMAAEVVTADFLSVALAVKVYVPGFTLFHVKVYGLDRSSPSLVETLKNSTLVTALSASDAVAERLMLPALIVALFFGLVSSTTGAWLSGAFTWMLSGADTPTASLSSVARAVMV